MTGLAVCSSFQVSWVPEHPFPGPTSPSAVFFENSLTGSPVHPDLLWPVWLCCGADAPFLHLDCSLITASSQAAALQSPINTMFPHRLQAKGTSEITTSFSRSVLHLSIYLGSPFSVWPSLVPFNTCHHWNHLWGQENQSSNGLAPRSSRRGRCEHAQVGRDRG